MPLAKLPPSTCFRISTICVTMMFMCIGQDYRDKFPIGDDRIDGHRYQPNSSEEKDGGTTPNSPLIGRGTTRLNGRDI